MLEILGGGYYVNMEGCNYIDNLKQRGYVTQKVTQTGNSKVHYEKDIILHKGSIVQARR